MDIQAISGVAGYNAAQSMQSVSRDTLGASSGQTGASAQDVVQISQAYGTSTTSIGDIYYDVKDLNKDGIVSYLEELIYSLKHPGEELLIQTQGSGSQSQGTKQYNQQGTVSGGTDNGPGLIDISV